MTVDPVGLGVLRQDVTVTVSQYPKPVDVTIAYGGLGGTVRHVSAGWSCTDPIGPIVCTGSPDKPLKVRVGALSLLSGTPRVTVAPTS